MNKFWFRILVVFISVSLLIVIFKKIDVYRFLDIFAGINIVYYLFGLLLVLTTQFLFAYRWKQTLLKGSGIRYSVLLHRTVTSYFFNNLFLGVFGGDFYKALRIHKTTGKFIALFSVIYNRIINTYAAAVFPALLIPFVLHEASDNIFIYYSLIISLVLLLLFILVSVFRKKTTYFISSFFKLNEKIAMLDEISIVNTMLVSLIIQLINIGAHYMFAVSLGIEIDFISLAVLYSVCSVIISIPLSINGIGIREGIFIFAFGYWGITAENALAFSFLSFTSTIILSIIGGSIFVAENIIKAKNGK